MSNRIWLENISNFSYIHDQALVTIDFCAAMLRIHSETGKFEEGAMESLRRLEVVARRVLDEHEAE